MMAVIFGQAKKVRDPARSTWDLNIFFSCFPSPALPRPAAPAFPGRRLILWCRARCSSSCTFAVILSPFVSAGEAVGFLHLIVASRSGCNRLLITLFVVLLLPDGLIRLQAGHDLDGEVIPEVALDAVEVREIPS